MIEIQNHSLCHSNIIGNSFQRKKNNPLQTSIQLNITILRYFSSCNQFANLTAMKDNIGLFFLKAPT